MQLRRRRGAHQQPRDPVAVLAPGPGRRGHRGVGAQHVQHLGPEPLGRVDAALEAGVVGAAPGARQVVDLVRLAHRGMVLPQHEHRVGVLGETRVEGERSARLVIDRGHRRSGRIDSDSDDGVALRRAQRGGQLPASALQALGVVQGMLAEAVGRRVAVAPFAPAGIGRHRAPPPGFRYRPAPARRAPSRCRSRCRCSAVQPWLTSAAQCRQRRRRRSSPPSRLLRRATHRGGTQPSGYTSWNPRSSKCGS